MLEEDRAKQLEEARKRVEELKKKKNRTKKKKTKEIVENDSEINNNIIIKNETGNEENETRNEGNEKVNEPTINSELSIDMEEETNYVSDIVDMEANSIENEKTHSQVDNISDELNISTEPNKLQEIVTDKICLKPDVVEEDNLFVTEDNEKDFLSKIKEEKENDFVCELQKQIKELQSHVKQLKFLNMDQETIIEELTDKLYETENKLTVCEEELNKTMQQLISIQNSNKIEETFHSGISSTPGNPHQLFTQVDRSMLQKWKNKNIDMTTWRSIGIGPIIEF